MSFSIRQLTCDVLGGVKQFANDMAEPVGEFVKSMIDEDQANKEKLAAENKENAPKKESWEVKGLGDLAKAVVVGGFKFLANVAGGLEKALQEREVSQVEGDTSLLEEYVSENVEA